VASFVEPLEIRRLSVSHPCASERDGRGMVCTSIRGVLEIERVNTYFLNLTGTGEKLRRMEDIDQFYERSDIEEFCESNFGQCCWFNFTRSPSVNQERALDSEPFVHNIETYEN